MSIAKKTQQYITARPAIQECLRRGIINYSALAREIAAELRISDTTAILAACTRYSRRLKRVGIHDKKIRAALKQAELHATLGLSLFVIPQSMTQKLTQRKETDRRFSRCRIISGVERAILVCPTVDAEALSPILAKVTESEFHGVVQLHMKQSLDVMTLAGVGARLFGLLAEAQIAVIDCLMIAGEHIMFCRESDLDKVLELVQSGYLGRTKKLCQTTDAF